MMHQNDGELAIPTSEIYLVLSIEAQPEAVSEGVLLYEGYMDGLYLYQLGNSLAAFVAYFPKALHYLDYFWLLLPENIIDQGLLWEKFYQLYSPNYKQLVNYSHNIRCLHFFKELINARRKFCPEFKILDFGCGPGFSADVFPPEWLVGYDNNQNMLAQAKLHGLNIIGHEDFFAMPENSFDVCIACYVFHMAIEDKAIIQLANVMKHGAYVVANFYKNLGAARVENLFRGLGFGVEHINYSGEGYGSVYIYRKQ